MSEEESDYDYYEEPFDATENVDEGEEAEAAVQPAVLVVHQQKKKNKGKSKAPKTVTNRQKKRAALRAKEAERVAERNRSIHLQRAAAEWKQLRANHEYVVRESSSEANAIVVPIDEHRFNFLLVFRFPKGYPYDERAVVTVEKFRCAYDDVTVGDIEELIDQMQSERNGMVVAHLITDRVRKFTAEIHEKNTAAADTGIGDMSPLLSDTLFPDGATVAGNARAKVLATSLDKDWHVGATANVYKSSIVLVGGGMRVHVNTTTKAAHVPVSHQRRVRTVDWRTGKVRQEKCSGPQPLWPLSGHASVLYKSTLYVFGGENETLKNTTQYGLYKLNLKDFSWSRTQTAEYTTGVRGKRRGKWLNVSSRDIPASLNGHTATLVGKYIYILGGRTPISHRIYDTLGRCLRMYVGSSYVEDLLDSPGLSNFPVSMHGHTATRIDHRIVVFGGSIDGVLKTRDVYVFDTKALAWNKWEPLVVPSVLPAPRLHHTATRIGRTLFICGGRVPVGQDGNSVAAYDLIDRTWQVVQAAGPVARAQHVAVRVGTEVVLLGGSLAQDAVSYHTEFFAGGYLHQSNYSRTSTSAKVTYPPSVLVDVGAVVVPPKSTLVADLKHALETGLMSDVSLMGADCKPLVQAHTAVLAARSPVLLQLFHQSKEESTDKVQVLRGAIPGLKLILNYLYTNEHTWATIGAEYGVLSDRNAARKHAIEVCKVADMEPLVALIESTVKQHGQNSSYDSTQVPLTSVADDLEALFDDLPRRKETANFTLNCGLAPMPVEPIHVHKLMLTRAKYFQTLFASGMKEASSGEMAVPDVEPESLKAVLKYLYCDKLTTEPAQALEIMALADRYSLPELKQNCEAMVEAYFDFEDLENVLDLYDVAMQFSADHLLQRCASILRAQYTKAEVLSAMKEQCSPNAQLQLTKLFTLN